jgi:uncharacterized damage-inducible protein DinB
MNENFLVKLFEHNNWANDQIIRVCQGLSDEQLDAEPSTATKGSIRRTLEHLVGSQVNYLALLTQPVETRQKVRPGYSELPDAARISGERLLSLAEDGTGLFNPSKLRTTDGYYVDPWVIMVQIINHATEHREQISSMLTSLGVTPPAQDGWTFGEATKALTPVDAG